MKRTLDTNLRTETAEAKGREHQINNNNKKIICFIKYASTYLKAEYIQGLAEAFYPSKVTLNIRYIKSCTVFLSYATPIKSIFSKSSFQANSGTFSLYVRTEAMHVKREGTEWERVATLV